MRNLLLLILGIVILSCWSCRSSHADRDLESQRAHDPWVFRSVLDGRARMLTIALHDNLWAAYSAQTGALYKAWKGGVNFDGAVYTTVHGPQPSTLGKGWVENRFDLPWTVVRNGQSITPRIQYRGHRFEKGGVKVNYELLLDDGTVIRISERPEYRVSGGGQTVFERIFTTEGIPDGAQLVWKTNAASIALESSIQTDGQFKILKSTPVDAGNIQALDLEGELTLRPNADTRFALVFVKQPLLENPNKVEGAEEEEERPLGFRLIARSDCKTCHNTYVPTIGPSYVDVAKKYRFTEDNVAMLVSKVKNGGSGVWGQAAMTPHPDLDDGDVTAMVEYIMSLDAEEEAKLAAIPEGKVPEDKDLTSGETGIEEADLFPGAVVNVFFPGKPLTSVKDVDFKAKPVFQGIVPMLHAEGGDFGDLTDDFAFLATGYLKIPKSNNYTFRLISDDGSRLLIDGKEVINNDGIHGAGPVDGEIALREGYHPFRLEYFQAKGGKAVSLQWRSFDSKQFEIIPNTVLAHHKKEQPEQITGALALNDEIPGDAAPLQDVHPSYDRSQARPDDFMPKVGGLDFLSDGRLVVSTWDAEGGVYLLDGVQSGDPSKITVKKIAKGLAEPLGVKVVDDNIYVLQKQELTQLIDHDGDDVIDEYYTLSNDWQVSANFHEFSFGLAYKDGYFYAALAIAILPGGASANPQIPDRGKAVRISRETGDLEVVAEGLRTPNGVGIGADGEVFIADNQGDWLPSSKILHVSKGAFFGSRAVDSARVAQLPVKLPVVWLPQDEIGNSPSTPSYLNDGPYKGQMIHGEVTHGGVKRVFVEKVDGEYQGAVFRFIQGLEAGVNRLVWGPDGALYVGGIGSTGNWGHTGKLWYGLQRLKYNGKPAFEMLAVRAKSDGIEIEFTEPLAEGLGWNPADYNIQQWRYEPTRDYGGPKLDLERLPVKSANVSNDRKKVFLELGNMKANRVVYVRLPYDWTGAGDLELWSTEAWYTMNRIPAGKPGFKATAPAPAAPNTLTAAEQKEGWKLLFDGKTTKGWRNFKKKSIGKAWQVSDGALMLSTAKLDGWQTAEGGDIITEEQFQNYDFKVEWKIEPCGNSGIIFNVAEEDKYDYVWQTGPEMQVLDNTCHPDAQIEKHRAGDLYDLISCKYETVKPSGQWNKARIRVKDGQLDMWLNGRKVVSTTMFTPEWKRLIANSKFKDMPGFGTHKKGHISLQDHGNQVWYRNIKIKTF